MKHKLELSFLGEISITLDVQIVVVQALSHVRLFLTPETAAHQSSGLHCLPEIAQIHVHLVGDAI